MKRNGFLTWAVLVFLLSSPTLPCQGAERVKPVTGSYKQALRKAGEAGQPLMIDFYTDWCGYCKKLDALIGTIPDTMTKFAYYRVNAEQDRALAKQFQVRGYPTVVFVKPDGTEFHRFSGSYKTPDDLKKVLESVAEKAGKIEKTPSDDPRTAALPGARSAAETSAANELKTALMHLSVGRKADAARGLKQIIAKYPGTEASAQAQAKLEEMEAK